MNNFERYLSTTDAFMLPIWVVISYLLANLYYVYKVKGQPEAKFFWPSFLYTLVGAQVIFIIVSLVIGGDLFAYYRSAKGLVNVLVNEPSMFFYAYERIAGAPDFAVENQFREIVKESRIPYSYDPRALFTSYLSVPFYILGNGSILAMVLIISFVSFLAKWLLFKRLLDYYPQAAPKLNWSVLLLPSMIAWATLIYKETYCIICLCIIFYVIADKKGLLQAGLNAYLRLGLAFIAMWLILGMKPYILYSFLPFVLYFRFGAVITKRLSAFLRVVSNVLVIVIVFGSSVFLLNLFSSSLGEYALDSFAQTVKTKTDDLTRDYYYEDTETGGSRYYIGEFDPTISGILSKFPTATFTALFRPLPNDVNSFQVALSALESTAIFGLAIFVVLRVGPFGVLRIILSNPLIFFLVFYAISFGFVVALSAGNFGNLTRYRSPMLPFFVSGLFLVLEDHRIAKQQKKSRQKLFFESQKQRLGAV